MPRWRERSVYWQTGTGSGCEADLILDQGRLIIRNLLVTGGAGFIGSNFVRTLLAEDASLRIINLDLLTYAGSLDNLEHLAEPSRHVFVAGDICDSSLVERLLHEYEIDTIVHFAAETHVDRSILDPDAFIRTNVMGTFTLLETARRVWNGNMKGRRFHHISTDEVFGTLSPDAPAFTENHIYDPRSPYSASKASADYLVRAYQHTYGLPITITNCSNNYGPFQFPEKMIPFMLLRALQNKSLPVYGDGQQIRDWLYVTDHCEAVRLVLEKGRVGETYNIGGGNQIQNIKLVHMICSILDELKPVKERYADLITQVPDRPGHDRRYALDFTKIRTELGWYPRHSLEQGLRETIKWYLDNQHWIREITSRPDYLHWLEKNYDSRDAV